MLKGHIVVIADLQIVYNIKFCREDRTVVNAGELYLAEERPVGSTNGVRVSCSVSCHSFLRSGSSDVISQAGRRRSTSSRGAEKDVKSTSRGEEFHEGPIFLWDHSKALASEQHKACVSLANFCVIVKVPALYYTLWLVYLFDCNKYI